jgi:flagella basal body P-ring formation protein FlgA
MYKIYIKLLIILLLIPFSAKAYDDSLDRMVEDLIYEKINDKKVIVEITYETSDKVSQVKTRLNEIKNVILINYDPERSNFKIRINYQNGSYDEVLGRYESFVEVPVTSRFIKTGEIILASDITSVKTKINRVRGHYISNEEDIIGMQAKKHLSAGIVIKANELTRPAVIKMNDPVNITYSANNIQLKTSGIALGVGAVGDMIKVKNEDTGTVLLGQIVNKNTVQVGGE